MSFSNYADPVARCIENVYEEFLSKWSHRQDRSSDDRISQVPTNANHLPLSPSPATKKKTTVASLQSDNNAGLTEKTSKQLDATAVAISTTSEKPRNNSPNDTSRQDSTTGSTEKDLSSTNGSTKRRFSGNSASDTIHVNVNAAAGQNRQTKSAVSSGSNKTPATRVHNLADQMTKLQDKPSHPTRNSARSRTTPVQQVEKQQQHESRLRDKQRKELEKQKSIAEFPKRTERLAKREQSKRKAATGLDTQASESDEIVTPNSRSRKPLPPLTSTTYNLTPPVIPSKRNTAPPKPSMTEAEEAEKERARLKRTQEREAAERAIIEQQKAELHAKEATIKKCYYCWHYSQPCNLKLKPKCIPCHKNRRSCFGGYTRTEFCKAYEERTGKIHKLTAKDNLVGSRKPLKRKRSNISGRERVSSSSSAKRSYQRRPQRFFLQDDTLKCYRCWDRNLFCDLLTPRCGSCVKGRAACFGFKCNRQEFCELFEEETGKKHRWATWLQNGAITGPASPKRRSRRVVSEDEDSSELSELDGWNSETDEDDEILVSDDDLVDDDS